METVQAEALTGVSELFGYKVEREKYTIDGVEHEHDLVTIYIEDDGWYHPKFQIDARWLSDLQMVAALAKQAIKGNKAATGNQG